MMPLVLFLMVLFVVGCGEVDWERGVSLDSGDLILDESHGMDGAAWGLPDCSACHPLTQIHREVDHIKEIVLDKGFVTCGGCHGRNGTNESEPRRCLVCHNRDDLPSAPFQSGRHGHDFDADEEIDIDDDRCIACHVASDMNGRFDIDRDLTRYPDRDGYYSSYANISEFCLRCHNRDHQQPGFEMQELSYDSSLVAIEDDFRFVDSHGYVDGSGSRSYAGLRDGYRYRSVVSCSDCHAMHGTNNANLIIDDSLKGVRQLQGSIGAGGYPVPIEGDDYAPLCVLCHAMEIVVEAGGEDAGNGLNGVHQVSGECRSCHRHGEATQAGL